MSDEENTVGDVLDALSPEDAAAWKEDYLRYGRAFIRVIPGGRVVHEPYPTSPEEDRFFQSTTKWYLPD